MILELSLTENDIERIRDLFHEPDISLIKSIIYFDGWSTWEEHGGLLIFRGIDDSIQLVRYGYSVMAENNVNHWKLEDITWEQALDEINELESGEA